MSDFANPHFAEPAWLWLAFAGPVALVLLQGYAARARRRELQAFASASMVGELTRSHSPARRTFKNTLLVLALAGIGIALARPQWGVQAVAMQEFGDDVIFAIDCSRSMLAADVRPNRLERAKLAALDFARHHVGGRIGLVAFAGQAFLLCPLTFDRDAFEDALHELDDKAISVPGTDLGRALDEAHQAMEKLDRRKVVILLTDGEDLEGTGRRTAEALAKKGVVVFTVGIGTANGAEIQVQGERGLELVRDLNGEPVRSKLDEPTLRAIAQTTKGAYFSFGQLGEGLAKVRLALESNDYAARQARRQKFGVDRFHIPVAFVLTLLVAESLIGTRRRTRSAE